MIVWDIQTGVCIKSVKVDGGSKIAFCGQRIITYIEDGFESPTFFGTTHTKLGFHIHCGLEDTQQYESTLPPLSDHQGDCWAHENSLRLITNSKTNGKLMINVQEFQPIPDPLLLVIESFFVPLLSGKFFFPPISFHASFITGNRVIILNVRNSETLLSAQVAHQPPYILGNFSPDGCFFACGALGNRVYVWKNTPAGYILWSVLQSRLPFIGFSFSPTTTLILTWGSEGIQLLHLGNPVSSLSPNKVELLPGEDHLVACSADGKHIAIAQQKGRVITLLNPILGTPLGSIDTDMQIWDIKIIDNAVFAVDRYKLVRWNLELEGVAYGAFDARKATVLKTLAISTISDAIEHMKLSNDCSQIAFTGCEGPDAEIGSYFLYDVESQETFSSSLEMDIAAGIWFSPDGHQLWVDCIDGGLYPVRPSYLLCSKIAGKHLEYETVQQLKDDWLSITYFCSLHGYKVGSESRWVERTSDRKILWLPPSWRIKDMFGMSWDGNFLALVGGSHPGPIVIEFQP